MAPRTPLPPNLSEPSSRAILEQLTAGPKSVGELVALTGLSQPNVSNHLRRMRASGSVSVRKSGRERIYELARGLPPAAFLSPSPSSGAPARPSELREYSSQLFTALVEGDQRSAWRIVRECIGRDPSVVPLYADVMEPALRRIGDWYERGRISEADEHLATSLVERLMVYASLAGRVAPWNGARAILGAVAGNYHVVGLRMIADAMQEAGWEVRYLGANVPTKSFVRMVSAERPEMVLISASAAEQIEEARRLAKELLMLREDDINFKLAIGGAAFAHQPHLAKEFGADITARSLRPLLGEFPRILGTSG